MEYLILALACIQSVLEASIVLELLKDACLRIFSPNSLILYLNLIVSALVNQPLVLIVANLALFASLKLLPRLLFNHSGIRIQVLTLKSDLFELLGKASLFLSFLSLLGLNLAVHFQEAFLSRSLGLCS